VCPDTVELLIFLFKVVGVFSPEASKEPYDSSMAVLKGIYNVLLNLTVFEPVN